MQKLEIIRVFNEATCESPHQLVVDGVKTSVRWNADTKKDICDCRFLRVCLEEFAFTLVAELGLDYSLSKMEKATFYGQILEYFDGLPD